jgi:uncharacterized membrane protein YebE (DUF533 family)
MHEQNVAIVKSLVSVAWSDEHFGQEEREMIDALLLAFDATEEQAKALKEYAETRRGIDDIPLEDLSDDDVRVLVQHAVLLTYIDGHQNVKEKEFVVELARFLGIPDAEATHLIDVAEARAKRNLKLL